MCQVKVIALIGLAVLVLQPINPATINPATIDSTDKGVHTVPDQILCICQLIRSPVCGSDGKTYANLCILECVQRKVSSPTKVHDGKCKKPVPLPEQKKHIKRVHG